jgi:hypothetical protein
MSVVDINRTGMIAESRALTYSFRQRNDCDVRMFNATTVTRPWIDSLSKVVVWSIERLAHVIRS